MRENFKHLDIRIYGLVQGVFFRDFAQELAMKLNISGFARNEPDGSVYIEAESEEKDLEKFLEECRKGPRNAKVEKIEAEEGEMVGHENFYIR